MIDDGIVYRQTTKAPTDGEPAVQIGPEARFALRPLAQLPHLEQIDQILNAEQIAAFKQHYIKEAIDTEMQSRAAINDYERARSCVKFIMHDVLPLMIDTAHDVGELIGIKLEGTRTGKDVIDDVLREASQDAPASQTEETDSLLSSLRERLDDQEVYPLIEEGGEPRSVFERIVNGAPIYCTGDGVWKLVDTPVRDGENELMVVKDDKRLHPRYIGTVQEFSGRYLEALLLQHRYQALDESKELIEAEHAKQVDIRSGFDGVIQRPEMTVGNMGWVRNRESYYVFWEVPKFAMRNPIRTDVYHPFPPTRVAARIRSDDGHIYADGPYIANAMVHPFLSDWEHPYQHICILTAHGFKSTPEDIVQGISTAINAFTNGLTLESLDRHGSRNEKESKYFGHTLAETWEKVGELTRDQAESRGYKITNEWHIIGGENNG